jgi:hypothetical protein
MLFDRVCVISLARRKDRLADFMSRVPADFPFGRIEAVDAIDGRIVKHPKWWRQGAGAWGCYRSHMRIIEDSLHRGHQRVMIFEDDATFVDDFASKATAYLESLPLGWIQAYLGGQHLRRPIAIEGRTLAVRAHTVNRTHAYAINGREGLLALYRHITDTSDWHNGHHIDHHFGRLHRSSKVGYYAPSSWLCGQAEGESDIACKQMAERWWQPKNKPIDAAGQRFVAVIGLHRSGSSAVAMMLHKLGVSMGDTLRGYEASGGGEAVGLANTCEWAARFPATTIVRPRQAVQSRLSSWIERRLRDRDIAGGKYPHLCALGKELMAVCGDRLRVVVCDRPLEDSIDSLKRRSRKCRGWLAVSDEQAEAVQRWLWEERNKFLSQIDESRVLRLPWKQTRETPAVSAAALIEFLGIRPSPEQVAAAVTHIQKTE